MSEDQKTPLFSMYAEVVCVELARMTEEQLDVVHERHRQSFGTEPPYFGDGAELHAVAWALVLDWWRDDREFFPKNRAEARRAVREYLCPR